MNKSTFKKNLFNLLDKEIDNLDFEDKMNYLEKLIIDYQKENENYRNTSNKGKPWSDHELKIILLDAPTEYNCLKYAKLFKRGYGSIEQIYRWSTTPKSNLSNERKKDKFISQIMKVSKEIGHRG